MPGTVPATWDTAVNKTNEEPTLLELIFWQKDEDNNSINNKKYINYIVS